MPNKSVLNLLTFARIYLFLQLFSMPIIFFLFKESTLFTMLSDLNLEPFNQMSLIVSILGFMFFYTGGLFKLYKPTAITFNTDWSERWVERTAWIAFALGFVLKILRLISGSSIEVTTAKIGLIENPTVVFLLSLNWFHLLALSFLGIFYHENKAKAENQKKIPGQYYRWFFAFYVICGSLNGATSFVIFPIAIHLAIHQHYKPFKKRHLIMGFFILISVIFLKITIKNLILDDPKSETSPSSLAWFLIYRIGASYVIAPIVNNPIFKYGYGVSEQFFYSLNIPGFDYAVPDGNLLGRFYGIISQRDFATGIAITNVGDFFLHLGLIGVIIGMFSMGILYRFINDFSKSDNRLFLLIYSMLWPIMIHGLESPISVLLATCVKMTLLCLTTYLITRTIVNSFTPKLAFECNT